MLPRVNKSNCRSEIELHVRVILKFKYYGIPSNAKKIQNGDILRDCRKSPKMPNLPISHSMKSMSYKQQNRKFRVFRQSLRVPQVYLDFRYPKYHNF